MKNTIIAIISALIINPAMAQAPQNGEQPGQCKCGTECPCGKRMHRPQKGQRPQWNKEGQRPQWGKRGQKPQNGEQAKMPQFPAAINVLCVTESQKPEGAQKPGMRKTFGFGQKRHGHRHMVVRNHRHQGFRGNKSGFKALTLGARPEIKAKRIQFPTLGQKAQRPVMRTQKPLTLGGNPQIKAKRVQFPVMRTQKAQRPNFHRHGMYRHMAGQKFQRPVMGRGMRHAAPCRSINPTDRKNPHGAWKRVSAKRFVFGPKRHRRSH